MGLGRVGHKTVTEYACKHGVCIKKGKGAMGHMKDGAMLLALEMRECFLKAGKGKGPDSPLEPWKERKETSLPTPCF